MTPPPDDAAVRAVRREPPVFRPVTVRSAAALTPRLVRVTLGGDALAGLRADEPAASVRLLLPDPGADEMVLPVWNGNEFLAADGSRARIRTFTPRHLDTTALTIDLDVVVHGEGPASAWATAAEAGAPAAISGTGRGCAIDADARAFLLVGDESAIPAISQLLEAIPVAAAVEVHVEAADPSARLALPAHRGAEVTWHDLTPGAAPGSAMASAVGAAAIGADTVVWVAGEAAGVQRIRRHLFDERGLTRTRATVRGYWKHGRPGT